MTVAQHDDYYRQQYHKGVYTHSFEQDVDTARTRLKRYAIPRGKSMVDVGCGNGAFLVEAEKGGLDVTGVEVAVGACQHRNTYERDLTDIHFPTDSFDVLCSHDCIEHLRDPLRHVQECFRITAMGGRALFEVPDFHGRGGKKHWKAVEHIWVFTRDHMQFLLEQAGFKVDKVLSPVSGKVLFDCTKPHEDRPSVLVPPGVGDIYWVMLKLEAFCRREGLSLPDVFISSPDGGRDRSIEYVQRVPFVHAAGYTPHSTKSEVFKDAYMHGKSSIFKDVCGKDFFIAYNGVMRFGASLDKVDDLETDWFFPMFRSLKEEQYGRRAREQYGDYVVAYFVPHGTYKRWLDEFNLNSTADALHQIAAETGKKILLVGAKWDMNALETELMSRDTKNDFVNLVGQTSLEEVFGLMRYADGVIGYPSGITIMSTVFRTPTLMLWNSYYHPSFWWYSCPPQARGAWYNAMDTKTCTVPTVTGAMVGLMQGKSDSRTTQKVPDRPIKSVDTPNPRQHKGIKKGLTVACVLKSGGDFDERYVLALRHGVDKNLHKNHRFVCLSDVSITCCERIRLEHGWKGWWSKLELFRQGLFDDDMVLYLDLDTLIVGDMDPLLDIDHKFSMLHGFRHVERRASGVMIWRGDYSHLYEEMVLRADEILDPDTQQFLPWDQDFIDKNVQKFYGFRPTPIQPMFPVFSYKRHCKEGLPRRASIVCFHGVPRPHQVNDPWVVENWK